MIAPATPRRYAILGVLLLAAILRLQGVTQPLIDNQTSWRETDTAGFAENFFLRSPNIFLPDMIWNGPEPNYVGYEFQTITFLASLAYRIVGQHDWVGRSIAICFGVWGIFAFYKLMTRAWAERPALFGAFALAITPGAVYTDRLFMPDPVMFSLVVTGAWLVLRYCQDGHPRDAVLACAIGGLGCLTKVSGVIVGLPMLYAAILLIGQRRSADSRFSWSFRAVRDVVASREFILLSALAAATLAIVAAYYGWAIYVSRHYPPYYIAAGDYWVWRYGLRSFLEQWYFYPQLRWQLNWLYTFPFLLFVLVGFLSRPPADARIPWFFHLWMFAYGLFYLAGAQGLVQNPTNFNLANAPAAAFASHGAFNAIRLMRRWLSPAVTALLAGAFFMLFAHHAVGTVRWFAYFPAAQRDYALGLALRKVARPGDLVVISGRTDGDPTAIYYSRHRGWTFPKLAHWKRSLALPTSDAEAFSMLRDFQERGADWLGLVREKDQRVIRTLPRFAAYLQRSKVVRTEDYTIYRLPPIAGAADPRN